MGEIRRCRRVWSVRLAGVVGLVLACLSFVTLAQGRVSLARLGGEASAQSVITGRQDVGFVPVPGTVLRSAAGNTDWWRVRVEVPVPADGSQDLVFAHPYLTRVSVWLPGAMDPIVLARSGPDGEDDAPSPRALRLRLDKGLAAGAPIYLRLDSPALNLLDVGIVDAREVQRDDIAYAARRSVLFSVLLVIALLAFAFWKGMGDRSFAYLGATLLLAALHFAIAGGELRGLPWLGGVFEHDPRAARVAASLSAVAALLFIRSYLEVQKREAWLDRGFLVAAAAMLVVAVVQVLFTGVAFAQIGNMVLLLCALFTLGATLSRVLRGDRSARFLLVSWLPMILLVPARILQVGGWDGPTWLDQAVGFGVAFAGVILIVGLADRMVQLRRERDRVSQLALYDGLTGAFSRGALLQRLNAELDLAAASQRPLSVVYGDIDGFKAINDRHGHRVGDQCLRIVVMRLRNRLRGRDLLGRLGGDELLAVLPETDLAAAIAVAEAMRETVRVRPFVIEQLRLDCSLSLGVATWQPGEPAEGLLERADAALYASKQAGRDCVTASQ